MSVANLQGLGTANGPTRLHNTTAQKGAGHDLVVPEPLGTGRDHKLEVLVRPLARVPPLDEARWLA